MRLDFQKNIASSQFTLPTVSIVSLLIWVFLPVSHTVKIHSLAHGLWTVMPDTYLYGRMGVFLSMLFAAIGVYLLAELNNSHVLLRISSRLLSSMLALLLGISLCLHAVHPGHLLMIFSLLSFFTLFYSYQTGNPMCPFLTFLFLSTGALLFPKILYMVPVYWLCLINQRALSLRSFVASVLGMSVPFWVLMGIMINTEDGVADFLNICSQVIVFEHPDYSSLHATDISLFAFAVVLLLSGIINLYRTNFNDKTRVRIIYNSVTIHSAATVLFISLQPQYFHTLFPLLLVDTSIVSGHFLALTYNRFTHIYFLVMMITAIALTIMQLLL